MELLRDELEYELYSDEKKIKPVIVKLIQYTGPRGPVIAMAAVNELGVVESTLVSLTAGGRVMRHGGVSKEFGFSLDIGNRIREEDID